ncbi:MAG: hypothetical protein ACOCQR_01260 [bacterium]
MCLDEHIKNLTKKNQKYWKFQFLWFKAKWLPVFNEYGGKIEEGKKWYTSYFVVPSNFPFLKSFLYDIAKHYYLMYHFGLIKETDKQIVIIPDFQDYKQKGIPIIRFEAKNTLNNKKIRKYFSKANKLIAQKMKFYNPHDYMVDEFALQLQFKKIYKLSQQIN